MIGLRKPHDLRDRGTAGAEPFLCSQDLFKIYARSGPEARADVGLVGRPPRSVPCGGGEVSKRQEKVGSRNQRVNVDSKEGHVR